ncbi:MAG: hypothetical protein D6718_08830 [Acidobacteria bacterium]|nr:MAG: hypothetical protein D6718_08830 [Acidobacteriota bacterium]
MVRLRPIWILCALASLPASTGAPAERALQELAARVRPSVVEIIGTVEETGDTSYGTGFVVREPGLVLTNAHVVAGVARPMVRTLDGALLASVEVIEAREDVDLALLRVTGWRAEPLPLRPGGIPPVGTRVVAVGHPRGYEFTVSDGIVSARRRLEEGGIELIQTTAPISPGSSGGPLLDLEGRVVGVCSLTLSEGQNINFAVPAAQVGPFVEAALRLEAALRGEDPERLAPAELARLVRARREGGDLVRAAELAARALARHPRHLGILEEAAEVAWSRGRYDEVRDLLGQMRRIAPDYPPALEIEAAWLAQAGELERAVAAAEKALSLGLSGERAADAHAVLGECLGRLGRSEEALEHMERALASDRIASMPDYRVLHAFLLQAAGRDDEADREAVAALDLSGWDPLVSAALRERGLPRLAEVVSHRAVREGGRRLVRGVVRNRGPVPLVKLVVSAEGLDAAGRLVATGSGTVTPERLVPGQAGAFEIELAGDTDAAATVRVRIVDYQEPELPKPW